MGTYENSNLHGAPPMRREWGRRSWFSALSGLVLGTAAGLGVAQAQDAARPEITSLRLANDGETVVLEFKSVPGTVHRAEMSPSITGGWVDARVSAEGDGGIQRFEIAAGLAASHQFYRVTVGLAPSFMEMVRVGDAGNGPDAGNATRPNVYGGVAYEYSIGKYEVTNDQYAAFLNAVARDDPKQLYNTDMGSKPWGGIVRSGPVPLYTYAVKPDMGDKPVNYVSWLDAARFCNWLHNGRPNGSQDSTTTEDGAYPMAASDPGVPQFLGTDPVHGASGRNAGARFWLPTENEWYKAAYHQPAAKGGPADHYWLYPTKNNVLPVRATADAMGNINNDTGNIANYLRGAEWNGQNGNVTTVGSGGPGSESYYGVADMAGNVIEWCETPLQPQNPQQPRSKTDRGFRGGDWWTSHPGIAEARMKSTHDAFLFYASWSAEGEWSGFRVAGR